MNGLNPYALPYEPTVNNANLKEEIIHPVKRNKVKKRITTKSD